MYSHACVALQSLAQFKRFEQAFSSCTNSQSLSRLPRSFCIVAFTLSLAKVKTKMSVVQIKSRIATFAIFYLIVCTFSISNHLNTNIDEVLLWVGETTVFLRHSICKVLRKKGGKRRNDETNKLPPRQKLSQRSDKN